MKAGYDGRRKGSPRTQTLVTHRTASRRPTAGPNGASATTFRTCRACCREHAAARTDRRCWCTVDRTSPDLAVVGPDIPNCRSRAQAFCADGPPGEVCAVRALCADAGTAADSPRRRDGSRSSGPGSRRQSAAGRRRRRMVRVRAEHGGHVGSRLRSRHRDLARGRGVARCDRRLVWHLAVALSPPAPLIVPIRRRVVLCCRSGRRCAPGAGNMRLWGQR